MDCRASLAMTGGLCPGERSAAIHDFEFGLLDCRASLAETGFFARLIGGAYVSCQFGPDLWAQYLLNAIGDVFLALP